MITIEFGPAGPYRHPLGQRICQEDRQWFQANPVRQHYVRRMIPGEFPEALPGEVWYAVVRQLKPGVRRRYGFKWIGDVCPDHLFMGEDAAKIMCNLLSEAPGRFVLAEELVTRMLSELTPNGRA